MQNLGLFKRSKISKSKGSESNSKFFFSKKPASNGKFRKNGRSRLEYTWNPVTIFLVISVFVLFAYCVVQLYISVTLDNQSKYLQELHEEEAYLTEENQSLASKITRKMSKTRVVTEATKNLGMKESTSADLVYIKNPSVNASIISQ